MSDPFALDRFVRAQDGVQDTALAELARGRKSSHWIWFVFPQLRGLGHSPTAERYGISGADEARAYLAHPVLGPRLLAAAEAAGTAPARSVEELVGGIDALKLRSSMTLFAAVAEDPRPFRSVLDRWWGGAEDRRTTDLLGPNPSTGT
ncbi:DUF1810 domain-containing protein [Curtobacterium sp. Curtsp57]|uniref:DUF1810 domain-containing protein n=1 Tax=Curtobacterium sp. Curtsp57 TaxID=3243047 RepID=UPI0039B47E9D